MNNDLSVFSHELFGDTRIVRDGDKIFFVAKDVVEKVGNTWTGASIKHVPDMWKGVLSVNTPGGTQMMTVLSEQGLYFYLGRCDKPAALQYQMWIAGEVVPSIRKHGAYMTATTLAEMLQRPENMTVLLERLREETTKRIAAEERLSYSEPQVRLAEDFLEEDSNPDDFNKCISMGVLAKKLKQEGLPFGQNRLFEYLRNQGVLCARPGINHNTPTQKYMDRGWFKVKETRLILDSGVKWEKRTLVTPKGVKEISARIHELFDAEVFA